ncbi:metalloprotease PmbA [Orrella daihaiensis]|uniref:Metalloprotease PmbA n=1 Tax=Orrella daihaiensis TaxID=2782176 RepID=A0ABY4AIP7_9BURK|nr:metalloprotease PmbA [Orrella daihaiensis]UOD50166.1 metalloprotease PmbA [Orrella daihaiensis]
MQPLPHQEHRAQFEDLVTQALAFAKTLGASDAVAEVSEGQGLAVNVRLGEVETVEQTRDRSLSITVYAGQRRGSASTSDFSRVALEQTVQAAWHIARYTAEDPAAGLPEADKLMLQGSPDLSLYHPWAITVDEAARLAIEAEEAARGVSKQITNSEGASVDSHEGQFVMGNTRGFLDGYTYTRHGLSVVPIAGRGDNMQRDYWYTSDRIAHRLAAPAEVGRYAAQRVLSRLNARRLSTRQVPVLFEAPLALGLLGALTQAVSGGALYRKTTFLLDSLGQSIFPDHVFIDENPFVPAALGSGAFDDEGVRTELRQIVSAGILQSYFLSTYTARKLGMQTTGHAGGSHNLRLYSTKTNPSDDLAGMLKEMGTGLLVTELIGQGVNYVTGDYSRGAFGYWVENGEIQYPVQEITIAGNLKDMFRQIVKVGADELTRGSKTTGSILIERMSIAGT